MIMPQMGESITEATILKWRKSEGDVVEKDETILEISTDKVDSEIPAPASGKLVKIIAKEGQTVAVKSVIALIGEEATAAPSQPAAPAQTATQVASSTIPASSGEMPSHVGEKFLSPLVRSVAAQHGLSANEISALSGSGLNGRITKEDVIGYIEGKSSKQEAPQQPAPVQQAPIQEATRPQAPAQNYDPSGVKVEPFDNMRKLIAEHMVRSKATSPHVYSMAEIDVTNIAKWRAKVQNSFVGREGFKLSFTPFFLEAVVKALQQFPRINASVDGTNLIIKRDINLGCAVALGKEGLDGLIVPVIKNAGQLNLAGLAQGLNNLAQKARDKKLKPDDIQGGTFTITNAGVFGSIAGMPIINQPQLGILSLGAIKKRPVVIDDAIAIRETIFVTFAYDHRIIDGALAGHFLSFITKHLENWNADRSV